MHGQISKLILIILGFVLTSVLSTITYLYFSNKQDVIEIYSVVSTNSDNSTLKLNTDLLDKSNSYFHKKRISIQVSKGEKVLGTIESISGVENDRIISGKLDNEGEFRIRIENDSISGPIFTKTNTYLITSEQNSLVLDSIVNESQTIIGEAKTEIVSNIPKLNNSTSSKAKNLQNEITKQIEERPSALVGDKNLMAIKETENQLREVYDNSNILATTYPDKALEYLRKVEPIKKDESYLFVPSNINQLQSNFKLELPNKKKVDVVKSETRYQSETNFKNTQDPNNTAFITYDNGILVGEVVMDGKTFEIRPTKQGQTHKLHPINMEVNKSKRGIDVIEPPKGTDNYETRKATNSNYKINLESSININSDNTQVAVGTKLLDDSRSDGIDLAVIYTGEALALSQGSKEVLQGKVYRNVDAINEALRNNKIKTRVNLVGIAQISGDVETASGRRPGTVIEKLSANSYAMNYRMHRKADLVMFLTGELNNVCGVGYLSYFYEGSAEWGYSATVGSDSCMATTWGTFSHEIGHNLGLEHDRPNSSGNGHLEYNYGYTDRISFRDIMSYSSTCTAPCPMIKYFSDSIRTWNNKKIGNAYNDNARAARHSVQQVANYFNSQNGKLSSEPWQYRYRPKGFFVGKAPLNDTTVYSRDVKLEWQTRQIITIDPVTGVEGPTKPTAFMISLKDDHGFTHLEEKQFDDVCVIVNECSHTITVPKEGTYYWFIQPLNYNGSNASFSTHLHDIKFEVRFTKPTAAFHIEGATEGFGNLEVQFRNDSDYASDYEWDFNNDGVIDSTSKDPVFHYTEQGKYTVTLKAINGNGNDVETKADIINVKGPELHGKILGRNILVANFRDTPVYGKTSAVFEFKIEDKSFATRISSVKWDLNNDGSIESTDDIYTATLSAGTYRLNAIVTDGELVKEILVKDFIIVKSAEVDGVGSFAPSSGQFYLSGPELSSEDTMNQSFQFENVPANGNQKAVVGDWDGDGKDSVGIFDFRTNTWYLTNQQVSTNAELTFVKGIDEVSDLFSAIPIAGDWDGDGKDSIGLYLEGKWYIANDINSTTWETTFNFGGLPLANGPFYPLVGDWDGDGKDTFGYYSATNWKWDLSNESIPTTNASPNIRYIWKIQTANTPIVGDWDGDGKDEIGSFGFYSLVQKFLSNKPTLTKGYNQIGIVPLVGNW
jgi:PKD repeat protein